ncbi:MAG: hypothetical protein LLF83_03490 [Methanobacterium sp.]|nr:hypothetical protein [Methanobacterium sp.]
MRDNRFIRDHRGGTLKKELHYKLIQWAVDCSQHVMHLSGESDERLINAIKIAFKWMEGHASVGEARKASLDAIKMTRESSDPASIAVARSVGHAVATAHMADHSLVAAWYALRAVKNAGKSVQAERKWQDEQLPPDIKQLVSSAMKASKFNRI